MVPLKKTPLDEAHRALGARMVEFAGWEMPVQYAGVIEEHRAVRGAAGLFDVSHMGEIRISGSEAEAFIQHATPNDVSTLTPGRAQYSALLTERGTYVDDILVYRLGDTEFMLVVNASNKGRDLAHLEELPSKDAAVEDVSDAYALLALQGPHAVDILQPLSELSLADIKYYRFGRGEVAGESALVSRTGYTGEDGFELYLEPSSVEGVWRTLLDSGREAGLVPAGLGARDTLRLEAGMALYGHEIDESTTPWEAGLDWTVKLDKGDFVGREALVAQREEGVTRQLVGLEMLERGIARQGHAVIAGGDTVGHVTSGTLSPTLERAVAMAYVEAGAAEVGTELEVQVRKRRIRGRVVRLPFYRRPR